jgi:hypothetical protein
MMTKPTKTRFRIKKLTGDALLTKTVSKGARQGSLMQRGTEKQKNKHGTWVRIKIRTISAYRTANVERFSPTLWAHAIAAQTLATPKLWQEPSLYSQKVTEYS